jgi:hypothetical protein
MLGWLDMNVMIRLARAGVGLTFGMEETFVPTTSAASSSRSSKASPRRSRASVSLSEGAQGDKAEPPAAPRRRMGVLCAQLPHRGRLGGRWLHGFHSSGARGNGNRRKGADFTGGPPNAAPLPEKGIHVRNFASISVAIAGLFATACSSDENSGGTPSGSIGGSPQTAVGSQMPASAGGRGGSSAGGNASMASPPATAGGASSEGQGGMTPLEGTGGQAGTTNTGAVAEPDDENSADADAGSPEPPDDETMSFFVTSRGSGSGGDFGGIAGADAFCDLLATEASAELGNKTWRAYLSTSGEDARDRIGDGPWRNAAGVIIANTLAQLHDQGPTGEGGTLDQTWPINNANIALDEQGNPVANDGGTRHDIITGSNADGTVSASGTCSDWTSQQGTTRNGHSDRVRFMQNVPSWNSSHDTGCAEPAQGANFQNGTVSGGGGRGAIYCFASD